jgi:hypothetical protein
MWNRIEIHKLSFHEDTCYDELREEEAALERPYCKQQWEAGTNHPSRVRNINSESDDDLADQRSSIFLNVFSQWNMANPVKRERYMYLAGLVRWLCLPVNGDLHCQSTGQCDTWNAITMFPNLEYLEVESYEEGKNMIPFEKPAKPLLKLKTLKLRGYFPPEFVRYVCGSGPTITELQLAVLDTPDPTPHDRRKSLCRPSESHLLSHRWGDMMHFSVGAEERIVKEWASLIRATRSTPTCLTLDHRILGDGNETTEYGNEYFMRGLCYGPGYERFVEHVLPVLLEEGEWPVLQSINLFGCERVGHGDGAVTTEKNGVDIVGKLKARFGDGITVANALGRAMMIDSDGAIPRGGGVLDTFFNFDEDSDWEIPWQLDTAKVSRDWSFGRRHRIA